MFHSLGLFRRFRVLPKSFALFVDDVEAGYRDNPFHNVRPSSGRNNSFCFCRGEADAEHAVPQFTHAFLVMRTAWLLIIGCNEAPPPGEGASPWPVRTRGTPPRLALHSSSLRSSLLEDIDALSLLVAALCHDLEHPGTTNAYQVSRSED